MPTFSEQLAAAVRRTAAPVVVGLDPRLKHLPASVSDFVQPDNLQEVAQAYRTFCREIIDVVAPLVPAVKPQLAFFEEIGPLGMQVLAEISRYAREQGLLVILDGKRNDIGSTAEAYARAHLGEHSPWAGDALTVSPYLGSDSLQPFVQRCQECSTGIFVLVKTSNPGSGQLQDVLDKDHQQPYYRRVAAMIDELARDLVDSSGYGPIGAVAGATYPEQLAELRDALPHSWLLIPGYGAQGAGAADVAGGFDEHGLGAIVNSSRGIIFAHDRPNFRDRLPPLRWQDAVHEATVEMIEQLRQHTRAGLLSK